jgi:hypothetical protein
MVVHFLSISSLRVREWHGICCIFWLRQQNAVCTLIKAICQTLLNAPRARALFKLKNTGNVCGVLGGIFGALNDLATLVYVFRL